MTEEIVKLFPFQIQILSSKKPIIVATCGRSSGKSFSAGFWAFQKLVECSGLGMIVGPVYKQAQMPLQYLQNICEKYGVPYCFNRQPSFGKSLLPSHNNVFSALINNEVRHVKIASADVEDNLRSGNYSWILMDEAAFVSFEAFNILTPTLRGETDPSFVYQMLLVSSPNGMGWLYQTFLETPSPNVEIIHAPSWQNIYQVNQAKLDLWKETLSSRMYSQEIEALTLDTNLNSIFYAFSKDAVQQQAAVGSKFLVGLDQNVQPGAGVIIQQRGNNFHVLDEIYIDSGGANFESYTREIIKRLPANCTIDLCGDASGNARNVAALQTFYASVIAGLKQAGHVVYDKTLKSNPKVYESREEINRLFERKLLHIDPRCKHLIRDFEQATWKEKGTFETDKARYDPHNSEALIYSIWQTRTSRVTATNSFF